MTVYRRAFGFGTRFTPYKLSSDEEWREFRKNGIGGSDVAAIMGISPYRTALDVWLEKTGRKEPADLSDNEAVYWGTVNEANVANRFAADHPEFEVSRVNATLVLNEDRVLMANLDRAVVDDSGEPAVLEIKTASAYKASEWADGVPDYYLTQVTHYLLVTGWRRAFVAVLIGGNDYREYEVKRDEQDIEAVKNACDTFWNDFVEKRVMPEVVGDDMPRLTSLHASHTDEFVTPDDCSEIDLLISDYKEALEREKAAQSQKRDAQAKLCKIIGDNKGLVTDVARVTWSRGESARFDGKRFKEEHPDEYEEYTSVVPRSTFRVTEV